MIVEVVFDLPLHRTFDYLGEEVTQEDVGCCVRVPWGKSEKIGLILALKYASDYPPEKLKPISAVWRHIPPLSGEDWQLIKFASRYYHYPLGATAMGVLPPALRRLKGWPPKKSWSFPCSTLVQSYPPSLNREQAQVVEAVNGTMGFARHLIYGITGSGKTEVYLALIAAVLEQGKQVLVLVPEINLTPQLETRIAQRWPQLPWVSLNSGVSDQERAHRWLAAQRGAARLVLGTRLAVFTPMPELGLIIVDEEHDASFKQQDGLRYSARDLAIMRAQQGQIPIVMGSATPALESWDNALSGRYQLHRLTRRAVPEARLPQLHRTPTGQAEPLWMEELQHTLARGEQALVFINRRGYAPVLYCPNCGWQAFCRRCSSRMVVHRQERVLRCHHCGAQEPIRDHCSQCGNVHLETRGEGTQKIEDKLRERFSEARLLRLDTDSLARKGAWDEAYQQIVAGEVNLLVGTQLVVKGHDFPQLSMVVVLNADQSLFSSDFRATERLMAQLTQVAGRAGRGTIAGQVWIETDYPEHALYQALESQDLESFWQQELTLRRQTGWPPYCHLAMLRGESKDNRHVEHFMQQALTMARRAHPTGVMVYDPVPALLQRKAGYYRWQLLLQCAERGALQFFLSHWRAGLCQIKIGHSLRWNIEVDPVDC